jgi:hypothetical protein
VLLTLSTSQNQKKRKLCTDDFFLQPIFVLKKQAFFSNYEWFLKQNLIQFCKIKKLKEKTLPNAHTYNLPPT